MMHRGRIPSRITTNSWTATRNKLTSPELNWTCSQPEHCELFSDSDTERLKTTFSSFSPRPYNPNPQGDIKAREAIAELYAQETLEVDPDDIFLTASTSEAYSLLFKIRSQASEKVFVPQPSYPLLEHLVQLDGLKPLAFSLDPHNDWRPMADHSRASNTTRILVHPNNPTGTHCDGAAMQSVRDHALQHLEFWVVDEVFRTFPVQVKRADLNVHLSYTKENEIPTAILDGLSKRLGLPGAKLSWIILTGPTNHKIELASTLRFVMDQYLSVNDWVQQLLPVLLKQEQPRHNLIKQRVQTNFALIQEWVKQNPSASILATEAGWQTCIQLPSLMTDLQWSERLMREYGVVTYPGHFFDFSSGCWLVVSLLVPQPITTAGLLGIQQILNEMT